MTKILSVFAVLLLALSAAAPADARAKHRAKPRCVDRPAPTLSPDFLWPGHPSPQPNGCSPPVYVNGQYVGQDPDPNIRFQLLRDPATGFSAGQYSN